VIHVRIQGHPSRGHLHAPLAEALGLPVDVMLHEGDPPDPWAGYQNCLRDLPDVSHVLVVQDDALPCANFAVAIDTIAEKNVSFPVCLFLGAAPASTAGRARRAMHRGQRYISLGVTPFVPLVAVLWPREKAEEFLDWSEGAKGLTRADDGNVAKWMKRTRQHFLVTVPSLVDHNDEVPSVKGGRDAKGESWRTALFLAEDGLQYDW
jgi:hypothetical protein